MVFTTENSMDTPNIGCLDSPIILRSGHNSQALKPFLSNFGDNKMKQIIINTTLAIGLAVALAYAGPILDAHGTQHEIERKQVRDKNSTQEERFERAAQAMCGDQAAWERIDSVTVQCYTHKGKKTTRGTL